MTLLGGLIFSLSLGASQAESNWLLRSLSDASVRKFDLAQFDRPFVFLIFQPNCTACKKQVSDLKCIEEKYEIVLVGAYASERELRGEYRRLRTSYPAFLAENSLLTFLKASKGLTPQLIFANKRNVQRLLGLTSCSEIVRQFR